MKMKVIPILLITIFKIECKFTIMEILSNLTFNKYEDVKYFQTVYDFIIIGAGSGGCTLANRLTEISKWTVLLLEAGGEENSLTDIPILAPILQLTNFNWGYKTESSNTFCLGSIHRRCNWPRGKGLGGTSIINFLIYSRGNRKDFDQWELQGNPEWSYKKILPYFKKSEILHSYDKTLAYNYHGHNGSVYVEIPSYKSPLVSAFLDSAKELNYDITDPNGKKQTGFSQVQATTRNGRRCSAAKSYLMPVRNRPNLFISKNSYVTRILINTITKTAYGVQFYKNYKQYTIYARKEVILSAGSLNSPQLLMLSGIGPKQHLTKLNIPTIQNLKVGYNLQDHISVPGLVFLVNDTITFNDITIQNLNNYFDYFVHNRGPFTLPGGAEAIAFVNTKLNKDYSYPDIELVSGIGSINGDFLGSLRRLIGLRNDIFWETYGPILGRNAFSIIPILMRPKSRGYVRLQGNNPFLDPLFYPNFLSDSYDIKTLIEGIKLAIKITQSTLYRKYNTTLYKKSLVGCKHLTFASDKYWECHIRTIATSLFHQSGTCKMGPKSDPYAVVDSTLRVHGINRLRVVDASIMPNIVSGHPNAAIFMIAEKAADLIKNYWSDK